MVKTICETAFVFERFVIVQDTKSRNDLLIQELRILLHHTINNRRSTRKTREHILNKLSNVLNAYLSDEVVSHLNGNRSSIHKDVMETAGRQSMREEDLNRFIGEFCNLSVTLFPEGFRENPTYNRTDVIGIVEELSGRSHSKYLQGIDIQLSRFVRFFTSIVEPQQLRFTGRCINSD